MSAQLVWFKRDLRVADHAPLINAAKAGPVLCLYILEPALWQQPDAARQHFHFTLECLRDLYTALRKHGLTLQIHVGEATDVLDDLHRSHGIASLHSHQETGNGWSYERDLSVRAWCQTQGVLWQETPQFGVLRGLRDRALWQPAWQALMAQDLAPKLDSVRAVNVQTQWVQSPLPSADDLKLAPHEPAQRQIGGRTSALHVLNSFLSVRSRQYRGGISSPLSAPAACSRLSPYLAMGCVSMREVAQQTWMRAKDDQLAASHRKGLRAFVSRLHWHCHFIQKLESEPGIEWHNMHRGYDDLREHAFNTAHFQVLQEGRTGWPMVDACVNMLHATGWLNFRMRAMLVSVAAYPLWLHWRPVGEWLAREFLDYEPGIHWSQLQMQSGTTGINTTRIYNPIKQAMDQDPHGHFVRQWVPAMRLVPDTWLFEPWRMPASVQQQCGVVVGKDIPVPLVDVEAEIRINKARLYARKQQPSVRAGKSAVITKHASRGTTQARRQRTARVGSTSAAADTDVQLSLLGPSC